MNTWLSSYWERKKFVLETFLATNPSPPADKDVIQDWFDGMVKATAGVSLEADLNDKLDKLNTERTAATGSMNENRKSARLIALVQGATGGGSTGSGFFASVADAHSVSKKYKDALKAASKAAAKFIDAAKNGGNEAAIADALTNLIKANPGTASFLLDELKELAHAVRKAVPKGGGGDGSAYWPSTWVSSSSSSSGG